MGIKIGDIDIANQVINNEFKQKLVGKVIDWIFANNAQLNRPTPEELEKIKEEIVRELQKKYPNSDVKLIK
jgi:hypothetical protein